MQTADIVLIPPSDEQASSAFHVSRPVFPAFLDYLKQRGVGLVEAPEDLGALGSEQAAVIELEVRDEHSPEQLEAVLADFLAGRPDVSGP